MTFNSFVQSEGANENTKEGSNVNESLGVKVSFGNEIRRAAFTGTSYPALSELVAKLFELDQASILVKYQDEDGDKITMSSDSELQEALRLAKDSKKIIRLFVEAKLANVEAQAEVPREEPQGFMHCKRDPAFFPHGPFRAHGGRPHPGHPHHGHPGHPGHYARFHAYAGMHAHPFPQGPASPVARYGAPVVVAHGDFSPAPSPNDLSPCQKDGGEYFKMSQERKALKERKHAMKERKHAMKETLHAMKESASTKQDKKAIKEYKEQMQAEFKNAWKGFKQIQKDSTRLMARHVADVTIPDNSELPADTPVTKTWRLKNPGATEWPAGSQLVFISHHGDILSGPERVVLEGPVLPQQEVEVSVPFLTPGEPGRYVAYYRMATPDGVKFGQRVWVSFIIIPASGVTTSTTMQVAMDQ